ncbi:MAG: polysaccharide pyruvyl transferase family protein, partial [Winogradskyella arenosi]
NDLKEKKDIIESAKVYGVRGPLTKSLFEKYGADLSNLKFEFDPGLLIRDVYNIDVKKSKERQVLFIPHFRDLWIYKDYPKGVKVISIVNKPETIIKEILKSSVVYASSLHGIIFSHALNKPCVFVAPQSEEPLFKYRDYFLSIGMEMPEPIKNIHSLNFNKDVQTNLSKVFSSSDFYFPTKEELDSSDIIS